jgi:hypothetical protein
MTRKTLSYLFVLSLTLWSCRGREVKKTLTDCWRYDLPAIRTEMNQRGAGFAELSYMESIMSGLQFAGLEFLERGQMAFELDSLRQPGKWRVKKNGRELYIRLTDTPQQFALELRGRDTLLLDPLNGEGLPFPRMLVRKKKEQVD